MSTQKIQQLWPVTKKIQIFEIQNQKNTPMIPVCIYIYICQFHPLGPFHLYLLTLLALLCCLLAACLWLSVLQYWLQFIGNCTYQLLLGNFDCKPLRIVCVWLVIYWDIVRIITNTNFQSSLTTYFKWSMYVVLAIILKKLQYHMAIWYLRSYVVPKVLACDLHIMVLQMYNLTWRGTNRIL